MVRVLLCFFSFQGEEDGEDLEFTLESQTDLENGETYLNLLKENHGIFCTDNCYKTFLLQDFDSKRSQLKVRSK